MKKTLLTLALVAGAGICTTHAQTFPNGAMESWTELITEDPDGWITSNGEAADVGVVTTTRTSDSRSGSAIRLETKVSSEGDTIFGFFTNTEGDIIDGEGGRPFTQQVTAITGFYKCDIAPGDSAVMLVIFKKNGAVVSMNDYRFFGTQNAYTAFSFPVSLGVVPDSVIIAAASSNALGEVGVTPGSYIMFDDLSFSGATQAIPNGDFEAWTTNTTANINDWQTFGSNVVRTTDKFRGSYAALLETMDFGGFIGTASLSNNNGNNTGGMPFTRASDTLIFWYKYSTPGTDSAAVFVSLLKNGANVGGDFVFLQPTSTYTKVALYISAFTGTPDTLRINIMSSNPAGMGSGVAGSKLWIDEVQLASTPLNTGIRNVFKNREDVTVYPNPFNNTITVTIPGNYHELTYKLNDITGKEVISGNGNVISTGELNSGVYFVTISNGNEMLAVKKVVKQ